MISSISITLRLFLMKVAARLRNLELASLKKGYSHTQLFPIASYSPWKDDGAFIDLYESIKYHTLVDIFRCYELYMLAKQMKDVKGDILEVGVWKGGTAKLLRQFVAGENNVYLADTFTGVVKASQKDSLYKGGEHSDTSEQIVKDLFGSLHTSNTFFLKGIFPEDTGHFVEACSFKMIHIDVDTHDSAKDVFEFAWKKLIVGGMVIFDDYGFWGCEGVTDYFNNLNIEGARKIYNINGHGIIIKTA